MNRTTEQVVRDASLRARNSGFGKDNPELIRQLYLNLESVLRLQELGQIALPGSGEEMVGFVRRYLAAPEVLNLGSGVIFNLQGFLENDKVPVEVKDLINNIFAKLDPRDLNHRFGPCPCISCTNPLTVLMENINLLQDTPAPVTVH